MLLLILGDGVREGVESIAGFLQSHAGLQFSFGLVEFPVYRLPGAERLVVPRVLARTTTIVRNVVAVPDGHGVQEPSEAAGEADLAADPERTALGLSQQAFWKEFLDGYLRLDDTSQTVPAPARIGYLAFMMPAPQGTSWLTVYRDMHRGEVGVFLSASQNSPGQVAMETILADWEDVRAALAGTVRLGEDRYGRPRMIDSRVFGDLGRPEIRQQAFTWLSERVNTFVNVLRPRIAEAIAEAAPLA
jgi:hypothetical protein